LDDLDKRYPHLENAIPLLSDIEKKYPNASDLVAQTSELLRARLNVAESAPLDFNTGPDTKHPEQIVPKADSALLAPVSFPNMPPGAHIVSLTTTCSDPAGNLPDYLHVVVLQDQKKGDVSLRYQLTNKDAKGDIVHRVVCFYKVP
jgi:hypothetical protein